MVTLKILHRKRVSKLHAFSCYAPTYAASREEKDSFFAILQEAISSLPLGDCFVLFGDFNARIGSRQAPDEWWIASWVWRA